MEKAHKQRLVGGMVLLALGLILVPAILDFRQDEPDRMRQAEMPAAPDVMKMEVLPLEVWSEPVDPQIDASEAIVETPAPAEQLAKQTPPARQSEPDSAPRQAAAMPETEPESRPVIPGGASGWVVQVASFSDEPKAFKLRDQLRGAGHPAFIERGSSAGTAIYRVKVGPVLQRSEADRLKILVDKETRLNSLVMQYR